MKVPRRALRADIDRIVEAFEGKRILVAGDLMLDRYWSGEVERISPEAPVPVVRKSGAFAVPGGAANTACNVAALGAQASLLGVAGLDEAGLELRAILARRGVDCSGIRDAGRRPTTVKLRVMAHDQQVVRIDEEDTAPISASLAAAVVKRAARLMPRMDAVLISDYAKGFATPPVVQGIIAAARLNGKPVVVDPKGADFHRYRGATVIKPNRHELSVLTGTASVNREDAIAAARRLLNATDCSAIVLTEGKHGMTLVQQGGREEHFPSVARQVYDVTGAGDTALATLAVALAAGAALSDAVWLSNLAAGLAVAEPGTVAVPRENIMQAIADAGRKDPRP